MDQRAQTNRTVAATPVCPGQVPQPGTQLTIFGSQNVPRTFPIGYLGKFSLR